MRAARRHGIQMSCFICINIQQRSSGSIIGSLCTQVVAQKWKKKEFATYRSGNAAGDDSVALVLGHGLETCKQFASDPNGNADNHGRNGYSGQQGDSDRRAHQRAQLPQDFLLAGPRLLAPKRTTGRTGTQFFGTLTFSRTRKSHRWDLD